MKRHVTSELRNSENTIQSHFKTTIDDSTQKISGTLNEMKLVAHSDQERRRLLGSLKFSRMNDRRNQIVESHEKTYHWIFDSYHDPDPVSDQVGNHDSGQDNSVSSHHDSDDDGANAVNVFKAYHRDKWDNLVDWLGSESKIYWISGKPGAGKSTLVKYILHEPRTKMALKRWNGDNIVISHFFWRPGTSMQQNIKGMLCSILYQLLQSNIDMLDMVLGEYGTHTKESDSDWSQNELQRVCLDVMKQYNKAICIFIDGLDEVDPKDGVLKLLETIELFHAIDKIKLCLASRPEPLLKGHLEQFSKLRLQDLTFLDMYAFASHQVKFPPGETQDKKTRGNLLHELVSKAQGVFLWLHLAVNSINRGLRLKDEMKDLEGRINSLPNDLIELYKDMWARLNDDKDVYRQEAALYLRLVLLEVRKNRDRTMPEPSFLVRSDGINAFHMMLSTTDTPAWILQQSGTLPTAQQLSDLCEDTILRVQNKTAGLLQLSETDLPEDVYDSDGSSRVEYLSPGSFYTAVHQEYESEETTILERLDRSTATFQFIREQLLQFIFTSLAIFRVKETK